MHEWRRKKCPAKLNKSYRRTAGYRNRRHFGYSRLYFSRLMCARDGWNTILNLIKLHRCSEESNSFSIPFADAQWEAHGIVVIMTLHKLMTHELLWCNWVFASDAKIIRSRHHYWRSMIKCYCHSWCKRPHVFPIWTHIPMKSKWKSTRFGIYRRPEQFPQLNASLPCSMLVGLSYRFWLWYFDKK